MQSILIQRLNVQKTVVAEEVLLYLLSRTVVIMIFIPLVWHTPYLVKKTVFYVQLVRVRYKQLPSGWDGEKQLAMFLQNAHMSFQALVS